MWGTSERLVPAKKKERLVPASASLPTAGSALPPVCRATPLLWCSDVNTKQQFLLWGRPPRWKPTAAVLCSRSVHACWCCCCSRCCVRFRALDQLLQLHQTTIYNEVSCTMIYFGGGRKFNCHQPWERHYILLYPVHIITVCSVVGRIDAIFLYVLHDRY